jgi:hypothetical protein
MWFFMLFGSPLGLFSMMNGLNTAPASEGVRVVPEGLSS